jgi:Protein of unknown function (DUF429)
VTVVGVDVSLGRGLDVVVLEDGVVKETQTRVGQGELEDMLRHLQPDAVAIDAPPKPGLGLLRDPAEAVRLPVPPRPGTHLARRIAEYELSRRGIGSHQTHYEEQNLFSWMTAGFETFTAAERAGYPAYFGIGEAGHTSCEVFPYASYVALGGCLSPGRRWRVPWRRSVLDGAGLAGLGPEATIDALDAACAALTGERFLEGDGSWVGDTREGVIVLPVPELADRYRRCPWEGAAASRTPRLCECGCGGPVGKRFLPGHAATLRSRLVREARAGDAARRELARLGWLHHLKTEED